MLLIKRTLDGPINDHYPEFYPEFTGKMAVEMMPYMFGAIAVRGVQSEFFELLLNICLELPERFHRWYGDQYSLAKAVHIDSFNFEFLNPTKHMLITKSEISLRQLSILRGSNTQMITFKGKNTELFMTKTLKNLRSLLLQSAIKK